MPYTLDGPQNARDLREQDVTYNITDTCCQCLAVVLSLGLAACIPGVLGTKKLILKEDEAVMTYDCFCGCHDVSRSPYGELGNVKQSRICCCVGFSSNLSTTETGGNTPIIPGNCCESTLVGEIVGELRRRMQLRGDAGNLRRAEENARQLQHLHAKIDAVMEHLNIAKVPAPMEMDRK